MDAINYFQNRHNAFKTMHENDEIAKNNNTLIGRYIKESINDNYIYYIITNVEGNTVSTQWAEVMDSLEHPYFSKDKVIDIEYALANIESRNAITENINNSVAA